MSNGLLDLVFIVVSILDDVSVPYALGGSMASSVFGEPRATMDVDIAVKVEARQVDPLLAALSDEFYVPEESARAACVDGGSFNVLDVESGYKVDFFVVAEALLDRRQIERRITTQLGDAGRTVDITAPDDLVLTARSLGLDDLLTEAIAQAEIG